MLIHLITIDYRLWTIDLICYFCTMSMSLQQRIEVLAELGRRLGEPNKKLDEIIQKTYLHHKWSTTENTQLALQAIRQEFLDKNKLQTWAAQYNVADHPTPKKVCIILSGNIPFEGFRDVLNVFVAGHQSIIKLSEKDEHLIPYLFTLMQEINPDSTNYFEVVERIKDADNVIVTNVDEATRYYETYFKKYPNIIRKRLTSVAVLTGNESEEDWKNLGIDVFRFFGLSNRNVSKLYLPKGYDLAPLLEFWKRFEHLIHHNKFKNNFDYNYSLILMNGLPHISNGIILMQEAEDISARTAMLYYEYYENLNEVAQKLQTHQNEIQCIVANQSIKNLNITPFGQPHYPTLNDYPNRIDTMDFLTTQP